MPTITRDKVNWLLGELAAADCAPSHAEFDEKGRLLALHFTLPKPVAASGKTVKVGFLPPQIKDRTLERFLTKCEAQVQLAGMLVHKKEGEVRVPTGMRIVSNHPDQRARLEEVYGHLRDAAGLPKPGFRAKFYGQKRMEREYGALHR